MSFPVALDYLQTPQFGLGQCVLWIILNNNDMFYWIIKLLLYVSNETTFCSTLSLFVSSGSIGAEVVISKPWYIKLHLSVWLGGRKGKNVLFYVREVTIYC